MGLRLHPNLELQEMHERLEGDVQAAGFPATGQSEILNDANVSYHQY